MQGLVGISTDASNDRRAGGLAVKQVEPAAGPDESTNRDLDLRKSHATEVLQDWSALFNAVLRRIAESQARHRHPLILS
jgi:hypothetical protein